MSGREGFSLYRLFCLFARSLSEMVGWQDVNLVRQRALEPPFPLEPSGPLEPLSVAERERWRVLVDGAVLVDGVEEVREVREEAREETRRGVRAV